MAKETSPLIARIKKLPAGLKESEAKRKLEWEGDDVEFREAFLNHYLGVSVLMPDARPSQRKQQKENADGE